MSDRPYRAIEWPLWSWRNLIFSLACLLLLVGLVGRVSAGLGQASPPIEATRNVPATATATTSPASPSVTEALAAGPTSTLAQTGSTGAAGSCLDEATRFVSAWTRTDLPASAWIEALRPMAAPTFAAQLEKSDPGRVPASRVVGEPSVIESTTAGETVRVVTDGGRVDVVTQPGTCLVSDLQPAEAIPGAPTPVLSATPPTPSAGG